MKIKDTEIVVMQGDITQVDVDAIVNAANNQFIMGGGVAGVIKRKGGKEIEEEAVKKGPVKVGAAIITNAGSLKVKYVIHAATMEMNFKTDEEIIRAATWSSLDCADKNKVSSIAFCALGCGVGKFSYQACSKIMAQEVSRYLREYEKPALKKIVFVLYSQDAYEIFEKNVINYLEYMQHKQAQGPYLTVDAIIQYQEGIVMIERSNPPLGWALPGGFVDYGESVEAAIVREVKEETSLDFVEIKQFKTYSAPYRDPRFHTVSVVFAGRGKGELKADSDAQNAKVFALNDLPAKIAFDHRQIITDYLKK